MRMLTALLLILACLATACSRQANTASPPPAAQPGGQRPLKIVATVGMAADLVRAVAGPHAEVSQLIGAGVDPHLYKPTRNDVAALMEADMIIYVGLHLEGKMTEILERQAASKPALALGEVLPRELLLSDKVNSDNHDPHVWMDAGLFMQSLPAIAARLAGSRPEHADEFLANAGRYREQLQTLDDYAKKTLASIPAKQRVLVTAHDAFNYLGRAYGIEVVGIQGISTESEASVAGINALLDLIVNREIGAVFTESSVSDKNLQALIAGAASRGRTLKAGGDLYSDAMGSTGTYEGTYVGMIDHNVTTIARALGGDPPARGLFGRLQEPKSHD